MISLGHAQYLALEPLFDHGSPIHVTPAESHHGSIVDLTVTWFALDRITQLTGTLTAEGELITTQPKDRL